MKKDLEKFWQWYENHYTLNVTLSTLLFVIQLIHLYWMTTHVVLQRLTGTSFWDPNAVLQDLLIVADYTEVPALLSVSLIYFNHLRKGFKFRSALYITLLYSQFLHIFWITDEFVVEQFTGRGTTILPVWLAWIAIMIDYLELPVIFDTVKRLILSLLNKKHIH